MHCAKAGSTDGRPQQTPQPGKHPQPFEAVIRQCTGPGASACCGRLRRPLENSGALIYLWRCKRKALNGAAMGAISSGAWHDHGFQGRRSEENWWTAAAASDDRPRTRCVLAVPRRREACAAHLSVAQPSLSTPSNAAILALIGAPAAAVQVGKRAPWARSNGQAFLRRVQRNCSRSFVARRARAAQPSCGTTAVRIRASNCGATSPTRRRFQSGCCARPCAGSCTPESGSATCLRTSLQRSFPGTTGTRSLLREEPWKPSMHQLGTKLS